MRAARRVAPSPALLRALGVTRVARLTGLDRVGVEVAAAVRPRGHVLQVTQGKGTTPAAAAWSAVGEAAELAAAERVPAQGLIWAEAGALAAAERVPAQGLIWAEAGALADREAGSPPAHVRAAAAAQAGAGRGASPGRAHGAGVVRPLVFPGAPKGVRVAWVEATWLGGGRVFVPADAVYCPPQGAPWLGPSVSRWTSNGLAAHRSRAAAVEHAVLEVLERDAVARALPSGWTLAAARARQLVAPLPLLAPLEGAGFDAFLVDLSPRGGRLPVVGALLFDREGGPIPLTAGYACRRTPRAASEAALLEAAQSRLTEVHGAREDVAVGARVPGEALRAALRRGGGGRARRGPASGLRPLDALPSWRGPLAGATRHPLAVVELAAAPLHVVKVLGAGLLETELL